MNRRSFLKAITAAALGSTPIGAIANAAASYRLGYDAASSIDSAFILAWGKTKNDIVGHILQSTPFAEALKGIPKDGYGWVQVKGASE